MAQWEQDLIKDIRSHTPMDDVDLPLLPLSWASYSGTRGVTAISLYFDTIRDKVNTILEIGVNEFGFTETWLTKKLPGTHYVGIDIEDRTKLDNAQAHIHTIKADSSDVENNIAKIRELGIEQFDFIYIDGMHDINQVLDDWEYTKLLAPGGCIGLHDTNYHAGPKNLIANLDPAVWTVEHVCTDPLDFGVAVVYKSKG